LYYHIPDLVRKNRLWIWLVFIVSVIAIAPGMGKFKLDLTDEFFFRDDDPVRVAFDRFREEFGGDESVYIVYRAKDGNVFSSDSLSALRGMQEELLNYRLALKPGESSPLDHIVDITSLINVSYLKASENSLVSQQFVGDRIPKNQSQSDEFKNLALAHADYPLLYVSKDAEYGGIIIRTDFKTQLKDSSQEDIIDESLMMDDLGEIDISDSDIEINDQNNSLLQPKKFKSVEMEEYSAINAAIHNIIDKPEYASALEYFPIGAPPINAYVWDNMMQEVNAVMALTVVVTLILLWLLFRSLSAVLWPVVIFVTASIITISIFGWLDLKMNMMINVTVLLILVVGIADSVHILSGYIYFRRKGDEHQQALRNTFEKSGLAILLTSITTAIGMLVLVAVPLIPIQRFGISAAIGVLLAFVITVFLLPLMLDIWAPYSKKRSEKIKAKENKKHLIQTMLQKIEHLSHTTPKTNIVIFAAVLLFFAAGVPKIQVDSNFINIFGEDSIIQKASQLVDEKMGGTQSFEILIDTGVENGLQSPVVLKKMEALQEFLQQEVDGVILTRSIVNIVKDAYMSLNAGKDSAYRIPEDPQVLQQTLFLFNNANPADRRKVVSDNYQKAHITINMKNNGSKEYTEIADIISAQIDKIFNPLKTDFPNLDVSITGGITIILTLVDYLSWSQIQGFGTALLAISCILFFMFKSWKVGFIALVPNIFPLILVFGTMGYLNIPLDVDTLIVAPLMIGIVVDDTIHFLTHYREEVLKHGDPLQGIKAAFREVGQAIVFTSLILAGAFLTFLLLEHQGMKNFGLLAAIAIFTALIAELFLLPALLLVFNIDFKKKGISPSKLNNAQA